MTQLLSLINDTLTYIQSLRRPSRVRLGHPQRQRQPSPYNPPPPPPPPPPPAVLAPPIKPKQLPKRAPLIDSLLKATPRPFHPSTRTLAAPWRATSPQCAIITYDATTPVLDAIVNAIQTKLVPTTLIRSPTTPALAELLAHATTTLTTIIIHHGPQRQDLLTTLSPFFGEEEAFAAPPLDYLISLHSGTRLFELTLTDELGADPTFKRALWGALCRLLK